MLKKDIYRLQEKAEQLKQKFKTALQSDTLAEKMKKRWSVVLIVGGIVAFLGLFAAASMAESGMSWGWLLPAAAAVAAVVGLVNFLRYDRYDLDNRKLELASTLLGALAADTPITESLQLTLDFRDYRKGGSLTGEDKEGGWLGGRVRIYRYEHAWLDLRGRLADGNTYRIGVVDRVTRKEKPKRKYTKVRETIRGEVQVQLGVKVSRYGDPSRAAALLEETPPPAPLFRRSVRAGARRLKVVLGSPPSVEVRGRSQGSKEGEANLVTGEAIIKTMLWVYDGLAQARQGAA